MRESIGNSMILTIIITIIGVATTLVLFSLGYSKTYRIKNKVIDIIENNSGYNDTTVREEVEKYMREAGYNSHKNDTIFQKENAACKPLDGQNNINDLSVQNYMYCIYKFDTIKGPYYTVKVYMTYHLPIIGDFFHLRYSLRGDSSVILSF